MLSGSVVTLTARRASCRFALRNRATRPTSRHRLTVSLRVNRCDAQRFLRHGDRARQTRPRRVTWPRRCRPTQPGSLLVVAPGAGINTVLDFVLNPDGTFTQTIVVNTPDSAAPTAAAEVADAIEEHISRHRRRGADAHRPARGAHQRPAQRRDRAAGLQFSANVLPVAGPPPTRRLLRSSTLAGTAGTTYSVVGTNNEVVVHAQTPEVVRAVSPRSTPTAASVSSFHYGGKSPRSAARSTSPRTTVAARLACGPARREFRGLDHDEPRAPIG